MCLISPISCVRLINEWQSDDRSQSRVACRDFLELWRLKKREKFVFLTDDVTQNFLEREVKHSSFSLEKLRKLSKAKKKGDIAKSVHKARYLMMKIITLKTTT